MSLVAWELRISLYTAKKYTGIIAWYFPSFFLKCALKYSADIVWHKNCDVYIKSSTFLAFTDIFKIITNGKLNLSPC